MTMADHCCCAVLSPGELRNQLITTQAEGAEESVAKDKGTRLEKVLDPIEIALRVEGSNRYRIDMERV
jgi:hypothetical protein